MTHVGEVPKLRLIHRIVCPQVPRAVTTIYPSLVIHLVYGLAVALASARVALQLGIFGAIELSHATRTDQRENLVLADGARRGREA